jgi:hypothetical protein
MKTCCGLLLVAAALVLGGCGNKQDAPPPAPPAAVAPSSPSGGYLGSLVRGQQVAVKTVDVTALNEEIRLFNVQEGRNPKDLDELVTKQYLGALPNAPVGMKFVYDAAQGKVSVAAQSP